MRGGGEEPGRATYREWRRTGLSPLRKNPPNRDTKNRNMLVFGGALRDGEVGAKGIQKDPQWVNPLGADRDLVEGQNAEEGGGGQSRETAEDAGMRRGAHI